MDHIKAEADKLIKKYKTNDPFELCEALKIKIFNEPLGKNIRGFYQSCPKNKIIHLNTNLNDYERRFVCSHELGHARLHSKLNLFFIENHTFCVENRYEREANIFSAELIIADNIIEQYPNYTLEQIARAEYIPIELLKLKRRNHFT